MVRIEIVSTGVHLVLHVQGGASKTKAHDEDPNAGSGNAWDWIYSRTAFVSGSTGTYIRPFAQYLRILKDPSWVSSSFLMRRGESLEEV